MITNLIVEMSPATRSAAGPRSGAVGSFEEALQLSAPARPADPEGGALPVKPKTDGAQAGDGEAVEPADASLEEDAAGALLDETEIMAEDAALAGEAILAATNRHVLSFAGDEPVIAVPGEPAATSGPGAADTNPEGEIEGSPEGQPALRGGEPEAGRELMGTQDPLGKTATDVTMPVATAPGGTNKGSVPDPDLGADTAIPVAQAASVARTASAEAVDPLPSDLPARPLAGPTRTDDCIRVMRSDQPVPAETDTARRVTDQQILEPAATRDETTPRPEPRQAAAALPQAGSAEPLDTAAADWSGRELLQKLASETARPADAPAAPPRMASPLVRNVAGQLASLPLEEGRIKLQLKPQGMGLIEVELMRDMAGRQDISIRVQNPMVLEALRAERGALQDLLAEHGQSGGLQLDLFHKDQGKNRDEGKEALSRQAPAMSLAEADDMPTETAARPQVINPTDIVI